MSRIPRHHRHHRPASAPAAVTLALLAAIATSATAAPPLALPIVSATFEAPRKTRIPRPITVTFHVRSSPGADVRQSPLACLSLLLTTRRARKFENKARAELVMEVHRDGEVVQRLTPTLPFRSGGKLALADSCASLSDLLAARRLDIELGDTVVIEARIRGIRNLKKGERVELGNIEAFQVIGAAGRRPRPGETGRTAAEGLELRGASLGLHIIGTTARDQPGPRRARAGLVMPGAVPNGRLCVDFSGRGSPGRLHHPDTRLVANVVVRRADGTRAQSRLRLPIEDGQLFAIKCAQRTRSYEEGDVLEVNYKLNDLLVELPSRGRAELGLSIVAVAERQP